LIIQKYRVLPGNRLSGDYVGNRVYGPGDEVELAPEVAQFYCDRAVLEPVEPPKPLKNQATKEN
jgi:hypothetical protein